ncbi:MAG: hypothetical protein Q9217_005958 [Psora testacea]
MPHHLSELPELSERLIEFRHPGYEGSAEQHTLLRLYGFDHEKGGIHHQTALTICGIIACNTWDGWLTDTRDGQRIELDDDSVLDKDFYYFHVPPSANPTTPEGKREPYPVFACFNEWIFPHDKLPPSFTSITVRSSRMRGMPSASDLAVYVKYRDSSCRISDYQDGLRAAHICPKNAAIWFEANRMGKYCKSQGLYGDYVTNDIANVFALRADLHDVFDDQKLAIVPKDGTWKAHFFGPTFTLGPMYHNESLQELWKEISPSFILARLAWTIFPLTHEFNEGGPRRRVKVLIEEDNTWREKIVFKSNTEIRSEHAQSRKGSPTKQSAASSGHGEGGGSRKRPYCGVYDVDVQEQEGESSSTYLTSQPTAFQKCKGSRSDSDLSWPLSNNSTPPPDDEPFDYNDYEDILTADRAIAFNRKIDRLKARWVIHARPKNPEVYCKGNACKKTEEEMDQEGTVLGALRDGDRGRGSKGLASLCNECRGVSYTIDA